MSNPPKGKQMREKEENIINKEEAKSIVDVLFDNKLFRTDITRDDMNVLEELINHTLNSRVSMYLKAKALFDRIEKRKKLKEKSLKE